jgi:hypothetical protein
MVDDAFSGALLDRMSAYVRPEGAPVVPVVTKIQKKYKRRKFF